MTSLFLFLLFAALASASTEVYPAGAPVSTPEFSPASIVSPAGPPKPYLSSSPAIAPVGPLKPYLISPSPATPPVGAPTFSLKAYSPATSPTGAPAFSPKAYSAETSPTGAPAFSPKAYSPETSPTGAPAFSPKAYSPATPPTGAPAFSLKAYSPATSPTGASAFSSKAYSPETSPTGAPAFSPKAYSLETSPTRAPAFSQEAYSPATSPTGASIYTPEASPLVTKLPGAYSPAEAPIHSPDVSSSATFSDGASTTLLEAYYRGAPMAGEPIDSPDFSSQRTFPDGTSTTLPEAYSPATTGPNPTMPDLSIRANTTMRIDTQICVPTESRITPGISQHDREPTLSEPLLVGQSRDRHHAFRRYHYWRISSILLHCASTSVAAIHVVSAFRSHSRPSLTTQIWLIAYMIFSVFIIFVYRFIFPMMEGARAQGAFILAIVEAGMIKLFIMTLGVITPYFHIANCLRALSFLCLIKTTLGINLDSYLASIGLPFWNVATDIGNGIGNNWLFYMIVLLFSVLVLHSPGTRRPNRRTSLLNFLSFFLGEYSSGNGDDESDDRDRQDGPSTL